MSQVLLRELLRREIAEHRHPVRRAPSIIRLLPRRPHEIFTEHDDASLVFFNRLRRVLGLLAEFRDERSKLGAQSLDVRDERLGVRDQCARDAFTGGIVDDGGRERRRGRAPIDRALTVHREMIHGTRVQTRVRRRNAREGERDDARESHRSREPVEGGVARRCVRRRVDVIRGSILSSRDASRRPRATREGSSTRGSGERPRENAHGARTTKQSIRTTADERDVRITATI